MIDENDMRAPRRRALLGGAASLALLPRLGRAAEPTTSQSSGPHHVRLAWQPALATDVAVRVAAVSGLFAACGVEVDLVEAAGSTDGADQLAAGGVDACIDQVLALLPPLQGGLQAKLVAGIAGGGVRLLAQHRSKLRHIEDLHGRTIGVARLGGASKLFFSIMMRRKGIDPFRDVTWVELAPSAQADALRRGAVDAVAAVDPDGFALRESMNLTEIATNISGSYRDRTFTVLACSDRLLRDNPAGAASLTHALVLAAASIARSPEIAAATAAAIAPQLTLAQRAQMLREEAPDQHPTGAALVEDIASYADEMRLVGLFPYELNAAKFARGVCQAAT